MELLNKYNDLEKQLHKYFGYVEDWVVIPMTDETENFWKLDQNEDGSGEIIYAETMDQMNSDGDYYSGSIYTQRFLSKYVYRGEDYTMVAVDTHVDGNKFLMIFDNKKELEQT